MLKANKPPDESLKDFANIPEIKSIIPAMKRSLENYFENLANQIKPLNTKKNTLGSSFKKDSWGESSDYSDHHSFPKSFD